MNEQLSKLIELQNVDFKIDEANNNIKKINDEINSLQEKLAKDKEEIETVKKSMSDSGVSKKGKEIEIASIDEKIKKHNSGLNAVKTNAAYKALLTEIEDGRKEKLRLEDEMLLLMEMDEKSIKDLRDIQKEYERLESEFVEKKKVFENQLTKENEVIVQFAQEKKVKLDELPKNIADKYENTRKNKKGIAVVPVENSACGGCHRNLPIHIIDELKKDKELVVCHNCMRILHQK